MAVATVATCSGVYMYDAQLQIIPHRLGMMPSATSATLVPTKLYDDYFAQVSSQHYHLSHISYATRLGLPKPWISV